MVANTKKKTTLVPGTWSTKEREGAGRAIRLNLC